MPQGQTLILHIGLEKTATTSFQRFCLDNAEPLRARGLLYPRRVIGRGINHKLLAASYLTGQTKDRALALDAPARQAAVETVKREAEASGAPRVLLSAEHFSSRFREAEVARLAEDFAGFEPVVLVAVRDHYARFLSSYGTYVLGGGRETMLAYEHRFLIPEDHYMSVEDTLAPWEAVFGRDRVRVLDYDAEPNMIEALLRGCGIDGLSVDPGQYRHLASPRSDVTLALQRVNRAIEDRQTIKADVSNAAWLQFMAFSALLRRRLVRAAIGKAPPWRMSAEGLAFLDRIAARDQAWLKSAHGIEAKGSGARDRIRVADDSDPPASDRLLAGTLVQGLPPGAWALSETVLRIAMRLPWCAR